MSLVNFEQLNKEYLKMREAILEKNIPVLKKDVQANQAKITEAMEWDAFLERAKCSMPLSVQDLLKIMVTREAVRVAALLKFAESVAVYWPDIREEFERMQSDNNKLIKERHEYRKTNEYNK